MAEKKHAKLSPSGAKRWMNCPGSIELEAKCPEQTASVYAAEGTQAHNLAELCLLKKLDPLKCVGKTLEDVGEVTREMAEAVKVYTDYVRPLIDTPEVVYGVEEKLDLSWLHPDIFGTSDFSAYDPKEETLHVVDYKHGQGIVVDVEWNPQLMIYALGALKNTYTALAKKGRTKQKIKKVVLAVVQPRAAFSIEETGGVHEWEISAEDLTFWALNVLKPSALKTEQEGAPLHVGDHCRFCKALPLCSEQVRNATELAKTDFARPVMPAPDLMSTEDVAKVMYFSKIINTWASEVEKYAQTLLERGIKIPGYKLVAKKANRRWINEIEAERVLREKLGDSAYAPRKILSVKQAEDALKKEGLSKEAIMEGLWEKPEAGTTIAPDTDKRKEIEADYAIDFLDAEFM